ncbi:cation-translocating P-type ATPase [Oscillibacter sp.]|uniref:heavy metal translocating P-type ATPase n=1 Tax=Oscillibacter sp. TaxID=1945593 RepID=UPI00289E980D|nr:cation-translocating P-type ATPase [Oscillibacter sp.]
MFKKASELLTGLKWTLVSGAFLICSLILLLTKTKLPVDPAWVTVALSGYPLVYEAIFNLTCEKRISSALLISIAMIASITIGEVFAAGEVAFIMAIGEILEDKTVERAKKGLKKLIGLTPVQGRKIVSNASGRTEEIISAEQIRKGDLLRVLPGEAIPADGEITAGNTSVDQSIMTGESLPVDKGPGDSVFCGTINRFGAIDITASRVGEDSSLQKLIRMVQDAENKKAPMQRIADRWAAWLVPAALVIAVITFMATKDVIRAVTILVVFCPCALALATPTSIMAAVGQATKHGVIIKSGEALENMGKVDCIAFDKTGTLTNGNLVVADILPLVEEVSPQRLLELTAAAESYSEHPLAKAIVACAKEQSVAVESAADFQMLPGRGITAVVDGQALICGTLEFLKEKGILIDEAVAGPLDGFCAQGKAAILVGREQSLIGVITLSDTLRESACDMVEELRGMNAEVVLLTGDRAHTAKYFAAQAGIQTVKAELLPQGKVSAIEELERQGRTVCMIGDGVNDAPALKVARVGVAMGGIGSDIAVEAADIALVGDNISKIPYLKKLSNTTLRTIQFNITLSMTINLIAVVLSIAAVLNPITGALVHNAGSVLVVLNAALLYDRKLA